MEVQFLRLCRYRKLTYLDVAEGRSSDKSTNNIFILNTQVELATWMTSKKREGNIAGGRTQGEKPGKAYKKEAVENLYMANRQT